MSGADGISAAAAPSAPVAAAWNAERRELAIFAVATLAAWAHTLDEIRIGEFVALPFGVANAAALAAWPGMRRRWRAAVAIVFGMLWAVAVLPYHVLPLLEGAVTWQNVSGLSRVAGGVAMVVLGWSLLRKSDRQD